MGQADPGVGTRQDGTGIDVLIELDARAHMCASRLRSGCVPPAASSHTVPLVLAARWEASGLNA